MKRMHGFALAVVCVAMASSCTKTVSPGIDINESQQLITDNWKVSYYAENQEASTALLSAYTFTFSEDDSTLSISDGHITYTGSYLVQVSDNHNFGTSVEIFIDGPEELSGLSREWDISKLTEEDMRLRYDYDGVYMEFEMKKLITP